MMKFGLIGNPISHSLSPVLFKAGYRGEYRYDLIEASCFSEAYDMFLKNYNGINVTAPFKEEAFAVADFQDPLCGRIGAANILLKTSNGIGAYNSDYYGIKVCIENAVKGRNPRTALVVGCGGAGKAAALVLEDMGYEITLMNRTPERAEELARSIGKGKVRITGTDAFHDEFQSHDIIAYTLPVPLEGMDFQADTNAGYRTEIILEANYREPSFDRERIEALKKTKPGITYISGKEWLLWQAVGGFKILTGKTPDIMQMREALENITDKII